MDADEKFRPYLKTFPATELKPFGEPVSPERMQDGRVYFALQFLDPDLLVPVLQPLIFLGRDLDSKRANLRFFQHFESFMAGVRYGTHSAEDSQDFEVYGPEEGKHVFDYERALEGLMKCALNRRAVVDIDERILRVVGNTQPGKPNP